LETVETEEEEEDSRLPLTALRRTLPCSLPVCGFLLGLSVLCSATLGAIVGVRWGLRRAHPLEVRAQIAVPPGVNFGGWLVLEDWLFSGREGRHVASSLQTPDGPGQGACLPPLLQTSEPWPSEGILTHRLVQAHGEEETVKIFTAHRHSFIGDSDFRKAAGLGIKTLRVPLPWSAFPEALEVLDATVYNSRAAIVPDPFYRDNASFVTVPRDFLVDLLRQASVHGLKVLLDIHFMPGGSSEGTYNGVWPMPAQFWRANVTRGNKTIALAELGTRVVKSLVNWLADLDEPTLATVAGITVMNEPAHMDAVLRKQQNGFTLGEGQVLRWLAECADIFRQSPLPGRGVKLYMQLISTAFATFEQTVPSWWSSTFSQEERHTWAVVDVHWYSAWTGEACSGRTVPGGRYFCDRPIQEIGPILHQCVENGLGNFVQQIDGLKACSEFSLGTFEDGLLACNDPDLLREYLQQQLNWFSDNDVEAFFWTWHIPYAPVFQRAWSYKDIAGLERAPPYHCGP